MSKKESKDQEKYYVYHLIDPRCGSVFYVGKGSGDRIKHHERDAAKLKFANSEKESMINDIWACGLSVKRKIVKKFSVEAKAYSFEAEEIKRIGIDNLTNIAKGGEDKLKKAKARAKAFISNMERMIPFLPVGKRAAAVSLIEEMLDNLSAINKQMER